MRLRLPELLKLRTMTPYQLAKASGGRLSMSVVYRWQRAGGKFGQLERDQLEALCEVLEVTPGELFTKR